MNGISLIQIMVAFNVLILVGWLSSALLDRANRRGQFMSRARQLKINYAFLIAALALPILQTALPKRAFFEAPAKIWSAANQHDAKIGYPRATPTGVLRLEVTGTTAAMEAARIQIFLIITGLGSLAWILGMLWRDRRALDRLERHSFLIRRIRAVAIHASNAIVVPVSYRLHGRSLVLVPESLLTNPVDLKIAIHHELQHHRQGDTLWVYISRLLCIGAWFNPAFYFWNRHLSNLQEFACDESILTNGRVSSDKYARCLLRVAETAVQIDARLACATGFVFGNDRHSLSRRIEMIFEEKPKLFSRKGAPIALVAGLVALATAAAASQNLIQDRRVSRADAQGLVIAAGATQYPVVVNDLVLKHLNRFIGTPEGREYMRRSLARMEEHREFISKKLSEYGAPREFLAIPIIESGYQNLGQIHNGAGFWQFIRTTARNYGLRVDEEVDERLDIPLETDAAMRYLVANKMRFKNWELAVLAYNAGESRVQEAIRKTGSRDVWTLVHAGAEFDKDYVAKLVAAILIMKNPSVLQ